jgi:hypothetical protein
MLFRSRDYPVLDGRPSLLTFIEQRLDATGRLHDPVCELPDESPRTPGGIGWMAGARDGVMGRHGGASETDDDRAERLAKAILGAARRPRRRPLSDLYAMVSTDDVLSLIDPTIVALAAMKAPTADMAGVGTWLASQSADRGPVKLGLALLGVSGAPDGRLLHALGAHEEFTLYSAVAFSNAREDPEPDLFELAQRVNGWGRIHCVERLRHTTTPAVARWILVDGFRNAVMNEYLAFIAATTGRLSAALAAPDPGDEVLTAASDIIDALISGGPAEDIDDFSDAPKVISTWLHHLENRIERVGDLLTLHSIRCFCDQDDWAGRLERGDWTGRLHEEIRSKSAALLADPRWVHVAQEGLSSSADTHAFWQAERACRILGIDTFAELLTRIEADPLDGPWFQAWDGADQSRAETLVEHAVRLLDLDGIASGPSTEIGLGPSFRQHTALSWTLQGIRAHPGVGNDILAVALHSPSVQNRNAAIYALEAWGAELWTTEHRRRLTSVAETDPDPKVKERAFGLLKPSDSTIS